MNSTKLTNAPILPAPAHTLSPTQRLLRFFEYSHLPPHLASLSAHFHELAHALWAQIPEGPEKTAGLRKLLEAKDCFVRARLES